VVVRRREGGRIGEEDAHGSTLIAVGTRLRVPRNWNHLGSVAILVRSWNLFHGNVVPVERRSHLERMVRLAAEDGPDVVCLQEVPVWALPRLGEWAGMAALGEVAQPPRLGPVPVTAAMGKAVTQLNYGLFRSAFTGQATAILLGAGTRVVSRRALVLNDRGFRRAQAVQLDLPPLARLAWAKERRTAQVVRLELPDGRTAVLANLHASSYRPDDRLADAELLRAAVYVTAEAETEELIVIAGDFNVTAARSATLEELRGWGFTGGGPWIDHVVVRNGDLGPVQAWPEKRRRAGRALLSDHAPIEVTIR
jgi:endonuclease/exonuclease/phosphatase family metal-dependent hydrolase